MASNHPLQPVETTSFTAVQALLAAHGRALDPRLPAAQAAAKGDLGAHTPYAIHCAALADGRILWHLWPRPASHAPPPPPPPACPGARPPSTGDILGTLLATQRGWPPSLPPSSAQPPLPPGILFHPWSDGAAPRASSVWAVPSPSSPHHLVQTLPPPGPASPPLHAGPRTPPAMPMCFGLPFVREPRPHSPLTASELSSFFPRAQASLLSATCERLLHHVASALDPCLQSDFFYTFRLVLSPVDLLRVLLQRLEGALCTSAAPGDAFVRVHTVDLLRFWLVHFFDEDWYPSLPLRQALTTWLNSFPSTLDAGVLGALRKTVRQLQAKYSRHVASDGPADLSDLWDQSALAARTQSDAPPFAPPPNPHRSNTLRRRLIKRMTRTQARQSQTGFRGPVETSTPQPVPNRADLLTEPRQLDEFLKSHRITRTTGWDLDMAASQSPSAYQFTLSSVHQGLEAQTVPEDTSRSSRFDSPEQCGARPPGLMLGRSSIPSTPRLNEILSEMINATSSSSTDCSTVQGQEDAVSASHKLSTPHLYRPTAPLSLNQPLSSMAQHSSQPILHSPSAPKCELDESDAVLSTHEAFNEVEWLVRHSGPKPRRPVRPQLSPRLYKARSHEWHGTRRPGGGSGPGFLRTMTRRPSPGRSSAGSSTDPPSTTHCPGTSIEYAVKLCSRTIPAEGLDLEPTGTLCDGPHVGMLHHAASDRTLRGCEDVTAASFYRAGPVVEETNDASDEGDTVRHALRRLPGARDLRRVPMARRLRTTLPRPRSEYSVASLSSSKALSPVHKATRGMLNSMWFDDEVALQGCVMVNGFSLEGFESEEDNDDADDGVEITLARLEGAISPDTRAQRERRVRALLAASKGKTNLASTTSQKTRPKAAAAPSVSDAPSERKAKDGGHDKPSSSTSTIGAPHQPGMGRLPPFVRADRPVVPTHRSFLFDFSTEAVAEQLCLIEAELYTHIAWNELLGRWRSVCTCMPEVYDWEEFYRARMRRRLVNTLTMSDQVAGLESTSGLGLDSGIGSASGSGSYRDGESALVVVGARCNLVAHWVVSEVLLTPTAPGRARLIAKLVRIAVRVYNMGNHASLVQLVCGLQSPWLARLSATWSLVPSLELRVLHNLRTIVSPSRGFGHLRSAARSYLPPTDQLRHHVLGEPATPARPCIPFCGVLLLDLAEVERLPTLIPGCSTKAADSEANANGTDSRASASGMMINVFKLRLLALRIKTLLVTQAACRSYAVAVHAHLYSRCLKLRALPPHILTQYVASSALRTAWLHQCASPKHTADPLCTPPGPQAVPSARALKLKARSLLHYDATRQYSSRRCYSFSLPPAWPTDSDKAWCLMSLEHPVRLDNDYRSQPPSVVSTSECDRRRTLLAHSL